MNTVEQVKEGIQFTFKSIYLKRENNSFLIRNAEGITLTYHFEGPDCNETFPDTAISHELAFTFSEKYLTGFSPDFTIQQFPAKMQHEVCCSTQMILHDILNCKLEGAFRNMFMESKALTLLLCFHKCYTTVVNDCASCKFLRKPIEKEKIYKAREIILERLHSPPTIPELSLQIGINQCYLKKGFKEIFGKTIYDFVQEHRMIKAKMLLSRPDYTVSQVAQQIGFSSTSNFSNAFKKYTGVFPTELQQN